MDANDITAPAPSVPVQTESDALHREWDWEVSYSQRAVGKSKIQIS